MVLLTSMFVISFGLSGWAVLAAGALVASLLAVGASPVGAQDTRTPDEAEFTTKLSACVGDALGDQMFTDVSDMHAFKDAINCIAYYGITNGTGDGSTYSPNQDVTRAEMAVFIARAAGVAGVDLGDAMGDEFDDLGDVWQGARDAINQLADNGMISSGGDYRPGDAITRAEMASFLIGLLNKAAPNVTIDSAGAIQLGPSGSTMVADDWFADARASLPRANDAEISALYELGVTNGASAAAVQDDTKRPLDLNYEPFGTVNRGAMAAFITRALAHTHVRPTGVSAQYDDGDVIIAVRDENYAPVSNVLVDAFTIDTGGADLAFNANGTCSHEVTNLGGEFACEIDGMDGITGGDGETSEPLDAIASGGSTVWVWAGESDDKLDGDTVLFRLDIPEGADTSMADRVRVSTEFGGEKAHLGSSVLYTVQLEDASGAVSVGADGKKPAQFLVTLSTYALTPDPGDATDLDRNPQGASVVSTLPLTTDADGKATFSVSGLPDPAPAVKGDKYAVDITIQPRPNGNAPAAGASGSETYFIGTTAAAPGLTGLVTVRAAASDDDYSAALVFSTEAPNRATANDRISVKTANEHVLASDRGSGASNSATVTVSDQYGDPIPGAKVTLSSGDTSSAISSREFSVGRDGSYTFRYTRDADTAATETLTATFVDGDADTTDGTATDTVEWATAATGEQTTAQDILEVDTDANVVFVGSAGAVLMISYDSGDRFNLDPPNVAGADATPVRATTYAGFEKSISDSDTLAWNIVGSGSRNVNTYTLVKAGN